MQHPDLLLQHSYETLATYLWNIWNNLNIHLKHRGWRGRGRSIPAVRVRAGGEQRRASSTSTGRTHGCPLAWLGMTWGAPARALSCHRQGQQRRGGIPTALSWGRRKGRRHCLGGGVVVGLCSDAASRCERDGEMGRARWSGEFFFLRDAGGRVGSRVWTDVGGWTPVSKYFRKIKYTKSI
jgi:hypothetical protein